MVATTAAHCFPIIPGPELVLNKFASLPRNLGESGGVGKRRDRGIKRFNKESIPLHGTMPSRLVLKHLWNEICTAWERDGLRSP